MFPSRINVEFVSILGPSHIRMKVWERGSGETKACGTGAICSAVVSILTKKVKSDSTIKVTLDGGDLDIEWDPQTNQTKMTGPAIPLYRGFLDPSQFILNYQPVYNDTKNNTNQNTITDLQPPKLEAKSNEKPRFRGPSNQKINILLGLSGSVAAIKAEPLFELLIPFSNVILVPTFHSQHFFSKEKLMEKYSTPKKDEFLIYTDEDEWKLWTNLQDDVLHIELRKWADLLLIAPLDANTCAKIVGGFSDNLLTCVIRAWEYSKPFLGNRV